MKDDIQADWIGIDEEEYNERSNPYYDWERKADWEAEQADIAWKEMQLERALKNES